MREPSRLHTRGLSPHGALPAELRLLSLQRGAVILTWHLGAHGNRTYMEWGVWGHERKGSFPARPLNKRWLNSSALMSLAYLFYVLWLPWWLRWYRFCLQCRRPRFGLWVGKIPWRREWLPIPPVHPLQYPCLDSPMDRGSWRSTAHAVTESQTV